MGLTLVLGACARGPDRPGPSGLAPVEAPPLTIRFDNGAREHVHVYLIGEKGEWLLGRVETGARRTLTIPAAARTGGEALVQLAVVAGERPTLQASRHPWAMITLALPASEIVSQRWMLAQGQLASVPVARARRDGRGP
jgi:hypothetical protein